MSCASSLRCAAPLRLPGMGGGGMSRGRSSFKMGTVEMLVLFLLDKKDLYGYEIVSLIRSISEGNLVIAESTLYPTLYKLMEKKYISDREEKVGKRRIRVYYHLEESGRSRLSDLLEDYNSTTIGIERILSCKDLKEAADHE